MNKTIIALIAMAGLASAETQYFDFGKMASGDAINITASGASGALTAMSGSFSFQADRSITLSQTTADKNGWCDPFTGVVPDIFAGNSYVDSLTTQAYDGSVGVLTLTFTGLENGVYSMDVFGGFVGKDCLAQMTVTITGGGSVEWLNVNATNDEGQWIDSNYTLSGNSVVIDSVDSIKSSGNNQSSYSSVAKGYQVTATNIEVTDGTLTLKLEGQGWYNSYARTALNGVALQMVPEPTTATLSLLALAGLAARRRRK